jgi:hypothetical protein
MEQANVYGVCFMYILWLVELSRFSFEIDIVLGDQANQQPYLVILGQLPPILTRIPDEPS